MISSSDSDSDGDNVGTWNPPPPQIPSIPKYYPSRAVKLRMLNDTRHVPVREITNYSLLMRLRYLEGYYENYSLGKNALSGRPTQEFPFIVKLTIFGIKNMSAFSTSEDLRNFTEVKEVFKNTYNAVMVTGILPFDTLSFLRIAIRLCEVITVAGRIYSLDFVWDTFYHNLRQAYSSAAMVDNLLNIYSQPRRLISWKDIEDSFNWRRYLYDMRLKDWKTENDSYHEVLMSALAFTYHVISYLRGEKSIDQDDEGKYKTYFDNIKPLELRKYCYPNSNESKIYDLNTIWDMILENDPYILDKLRDFQEHGTLNTTTTTRHSINNYSNDDMDEGYDDDNGGIGIGIGTGTRKRKRMNNNDDDNDNKKYKRSPIVYC